VRLRESFDPVGRSDGDAQSKVQDFADGSLGSGFRLGHGVRLARILGRDYGTGTGAELDARNQTKVGVLHNSI